MPLHDWSDRSGWEGLHTFWMTEIARALRAELPPGYRAIIGSSPFVTIGSELGKPDVAVATNGHAPNGHTSSPASAPEPDVEVAVATLDDETTVQVVRNGRLVAVVELVSPRNKDQPSAREQYGSRYLGYLRGGVHTLLVDVHRRPLDFSFPQLIATEFGEPLPNPVAPCAVSYRVGAPAATGGRMLAAWRFELLAGEPLPSAPLALTLDDTVMVDLEATYARAAIDSYLD